jgi:serine/threonine protein kinase
MVNPNFKASELIATGGMASIYRGVQISLDRPIAIKRLHPHLTANLDFVTRFEKEAKSIARLRHENIVSIIDFGRDEEGYYLVMEYVDGRNLKEIIKSEKKVPAEIGLVIAEQVAQGLRFAHSTGLVHRDIKPANIMLSKSGAVKLTDFGIAKFANDVSITATGSMVGSPAYMSPEHVRGTDLDSRSDIFSLGVVLYELLSGEKPFPGENYQEVISKILIEEPKPLLQIAPQLSAGLAEIIHRCLEKEKLKRYQNCEDFLLDLKKQIEFYNVQPSHKLISQYLENPAMVASRLVEERIQRHLDWGIHYFNQGEEKETVARKEFLEVLRWDPNHQTALKYIAQLDKKEKKGTIRFVSDKIRKQKVAVNVLLPLSLIAAVLFGFVLADFVERGFHRDPNLTQPKSDKLSSGAIYTVPQEEAGKFANSKQKNSQSKPIIKSADEDTPPKAKNPATTGSDFVPVESQPVSQPGAIILYNQEQEKERTRQAGTVSLRQLRAKAKFGSLTINAQPGASVEIQGKVYRKVPPVLRFKAEEGKYRVYLKQEGYKTKSKKIYVQKGKTTVIDETLKEEDSKLSKNSRPDGG